MDETGDSKQQLFDNFSISAGAVPPESAKSQEQDTEIAIVSKGRRQFSDDDDDLLGTSNRQDDGDKSFQNDLDNSQWSHSRGKQSSAQNSYLAPSRRGQQPPPSRSGTRAQHAAQQKKLQQLRASQIQAKSPYAQHFQSQMQSKHQGNGQGAANGSSNGQNNSNNYRNWNSGLKNNRHSHHSSSSQKSHQRMLSNDESSVIAGPEANLNSASRSGSGMQQRQNVQQRPNQTNYPYRQDLSSKDARRGGTAPEGAHRGSQNAGQYLQPPTQQAKINISRNPYGMLSVHQNSNNVQVSNQEIVKFSNQQIDKGSSGGSNSQQQNQMIAKIYGKSNKFVGTSASNAGNGVIVKTSEPSSAAAQPTPSGGVTPQTADRKSKISQQIRHMIAKQANSKGDSKFVNSSVLKPSKAPSNLDTSVVSQEDKKSVKHHSEQVPKGVRRIKQDQARLKSVQQQEANRGGSKERDDATSRKELATQNAKKDEKSRSVQHSRLVAQPVRVQNRSNVPAASSAQSHSFVEPSAASEKRKVEPGNAIFQAGPRPLQAAGGGRRTDTMLSNESKPPNRAGGGAKKFVMKDSSQTAKTEQRRSNMGQSLQGNNGAIDKVLSTGSLTRADPSVSSSRPDIMQGQKESWSQLRDKNTSVDHRQSSSSQRKKIANEGALITGQKVQPKGKSMVTEPDNQLTVAENRRNSRELQRFLQQKDVATKNGATGISQEHNMAMFQNSQEVGSAFWAVPGDGGSFTIVNENQLNNTDLKMHGFTAPDGSDDELREKGLGSVKGNVMFTPSVEEMAGNMGSVLKKSILSDPDKKLVIGSDVDEKHGNDVFLYAAQNNVHFSEGPSAEKESKPIERVQERAGQSDLEALNRFFKQSEEQNRAAGHEDPDARYLAQRQHYNEMKRLQTSQGPRPAKMKSLKQGGQENTVQIDEASDEDLKSESYQNEADVESQFSASSAEHGGNSSSAGNLTPPNLNRRVFSTKEVANKQEMVRPPQTAPSSQMQTLQKQAGQANTSMRLNQSNSKLLKIKGKLRAQQFQQTQNVQGLSKLKYGAYDNQAALTDDQIKQQIESSQEVGQRNPDGTTMGGRQDGNGAMAAEDLALQQNQRGGQLSKTIDPSTAGMALSGTAPCDSGEAAEGARDIDDDRGDGHPATMKQNLMTRRRKETASGDINIISGSAPQNSRAIGRKDLQNIDASRNDGKGGRESSSQKRSGASQGATLFNNLAWPPSLAAPPAGSGGPAAAPTTLNQVTLLQRGEPGVPATVGQQFEQWQRPPSRQKQPNQALGLDDDRGMRPKTRGNNQSGSLTGKPMMHNQFYGQPVVRSAQFTTPYEAHGDRGASKRDGQGRERKRNIQQFIQQQDTNGGGLMYHFNEMPPGAEGSRGIQSIHHGRNNNIVGKGAASGQNQSGGHRVRMIDFFHQRNNNANGFNSTDEYQQSAMQAFQNQYHQSKLNGQQVVYEDQRQQQQAQFMANNNNGYQGIGPLQGSLNTTNMKVRRGQRGKQHPGGAASSEMQRPPSRHKDPPQNLGLDIYPPGMGFASPNEFDPPIGVTSQDILVNNLKSVGNGVFSGFDMQNEPSVEANVTANGQGEASSDAEFVGNSGLEPRSFFMSNNVRHGHASSAVGATAAIGQKQFKEDEDDFLESQYLTRGNINKGDVQKFQDTDTGDGMERAQTRHQGKRTHKFKRQQSGQPAGVHHDGASGERQQPNFTHIQINGHQRRGNGKYGSQRVNESTHSNQLNQTMTGIQQPQFSQTYGHSMMMGQLGLGSMQSNGHNSNQIFQYHPAMQQTKNFYISINQIKPPGSNEGAALMSDLFNMSADVQNIIKNSTQSKSLPFRHDETSKTSHQSKRLISTSQGPGMFNNQQSGQHTNSGNMQAYIRQNADSTQKGGGSNLAQLNYRQINAQANQDIMQRGFANQRSPVNDRSGSIHHMIMQNPHFKQINKPKSATGHRISGNKNRLKNLNNSGRFFGQNSTIIHSAYTNNNTTQPLRAHMAPTQGGWVDGMQHKPMAAGPENPSTGGPIQTSQLATTENEDPQLIAGERSKFMKQQIQKALAKKQASGGGASTTVAGSAKGSVKVRKRGANNQLLLRGESTTDGGTMQLSGNGSGGAGGGSMLQQLPSDPSLTDNAQELIKRGQELNQMRPKESQGYRSTDKRQNGLNNTNSLGVTSTGVLTDAQLQQASATATGSTQLNPVRYQMRVNGNAPGSVGAQGPLEGSFVSSPTRTAEKRGNSGPFTGGFEGASKQQKFLSVYQVSSLGGTSQGKNGGKDGSQEQNANTRQTRQVKRGGYNQGGHESTGLQQSLVQGSDRLLEGVEDQVPAGTEPSEHQMGHDSAANANSQQIQNSFKSQTLQLPGNFNTVVDEEFINLFAN